MPPKQYAAGGELLHGDEGLTLALFDRVECRGLAEPMHRDQRRQQAALRDLEARRVRVVDTDCVEVEPAQVELVAHLERHHQVLLDGGGILVVLDLMDLALDRVDPGAAVLRVERLRADGEERRVERERTVYLEPRDAEGHHDVGHGVGLGEQVADLGQGLDVPLRHLVGPHGVLPPVLEATLFHLTLSDGLHDLEAHLGVQAHVDQVEHDVVAAAHGLQNRGGAADDQVPGVAQPHVGAVGEAGQAHQGIEVLGLGIHQHLPGKRRAEFGDADGARPADLPARRPARCPDCGRATVPAHRAASSRSRNLAFPSVFSLAVSRSLRSLARAAPRL